MGSSACRALRGRGREANQVAEWVCYTHRCLLRDLVRKEVGLVRANAAGCVAISVRRPLDGR